MPQEFTTVKASSYDAASLAKQLTDKSADGWDVVSIVNTGTDVTAFLSRDASGSAGTAGGSNTSTYSPSSSGSSSADSSTPTSSSSSASSEPAGWGHAPASTGSDTSGAASAASNPDPSGSIASTTAAAPAATATPAVPAGWYADPAARFDLRYWDGSTWTEHVSRAGQQYTDPPVA